MLSLNLITVYSMVCALFPALLYMIVCRRRKGKVSYIWAMVFNLYVWLVYNVTGIGTLGDLINRPEGSIQHSVFQGTINLIPFAGVNISFLLNICMCIPLGFFAPVSVERIPQDILYDSAGGRTFPFDRTVPVNYDTGNRYRRSDR